MQTNNNTASAFPKQKIYEYTISFILAVILFIIFSVYIYLRRGFYDLYIANKIFAGVAGVQLGLVLLLGPLSRMFNIFDKYLKFRNELGIVAFLMAFAHSLSSLFFLGDRFPLIEYFTPLNIPFIFGLMGMIILTFLFIVSNKKSRDILTVKRWWPLQYWGVRIGFVSVALHVFMMKLSGWIDWYLQGGGSQLKHPEWPGLGLLVGWFFLFVIIVRTTEAINTKLGKAITYATFLLLILIYIFTFIWGAQLTTK